MYSYVNHQAMRDVFRPLEVETDPAVRGELILSIEVEYANSMIEQYERTCYELKDKGWNTGQIADALSMSERKVKTFISDYAKRTGEWNPLRRRVTGNVIDISHLVRRAKKSGAGLASPPDPTPV